jgi:flagellar hook-associated protein 3 FlgL
MTRISQNQSVAALLQQMNRNKSKLDKHSQEVSSGLKVVTPSDSQQAATITRVNDQVVRIEGHEKRIGITEGQLNFQEQVLEQAGNVITRGREIAQQLANETNSKEARALAASEVWALRDQMVDLANSKYQDRFIYGGADDDDPPFDSETTTYTTFGSTDSQTKYNFDNYDPPPAITNPPTKEIKISDDSSVRITTPGDTVFQNAIAGLEKLGRALEGYRTDSTGPDYSAFTFPADYKGQTNAITASLDELEVARTTNIEPERSSVAERLHQLDLAKSILSFSKDDAKKQLSDLRDADTAESATNLTLAQTALQASYTVTSRLLNLSILDYI